MKPIFVLIAGVLLIAGCSSNTGASGGGDVPGQSTANSNGGRTGSSPAGGSMGDGGGSSGMIGTGVGAHGSVGP